MPLLFATGAGAQSRIALGTAVVFGMAMNTLLATVYIPNFYELMQKLQEKFSRKKDDDVKKIRICKNRISFSEPPRQDKDGVTMCLGYLHYVCGIV